MESFFRYISYVDYYKKGEKIRNVGFLRWKLHNGEHRIEFQLKEIYSAQGNFEIKEKNTEKVIGNILIDKGIGNFVKKFPSMNASGEMYIDTWNDRLYLSDIEGFCIPLNENEYLSVDISMEQKKNQKRIDRIEAASENILIEGMKEKYLDQEYKEIESDYKLSVPGKQSEKFKENIAEGQIEKHAEKISEKRKEENIKIIEPIHEDKWEELCKKYQKVHPFPSKRVFLAIKPDDFIILQQKYQKLVHNSFLLHGFYNYGHMILGKLTDEEEAPVYIGVPGVYYEREKQAAQIFGFVGFESTEHPVQSGSYGYYMIEVEI